ncbi:RDD family protein [Mycoplasmatota bacterium WC30]
MAQKEIRKNIDGETIDFDKDDLVNVLTFESANFIRRMLAYFIDVLLMIVIWYLITKGFYKEIDQFVETLGSGQNDFYNFMLYEEFRDLFWRLIMNLYLVWIAVQTIYFMLVPAFIGNGRSVGKMLAGIGTVDAKTLEEVTPTKLFIREFFCRGIIETVFIIPGIVSILFAFFREDSKSMHDLISKTVVIKLDLYDFK